MICIVTVAVLCYIGYNNGMTVTKIYLSSKETAEILGISRMSVVRKIKSGEIKAQRIGRNYLIPTEQFIRHEKLTEEKKSEITKIVEKAIKEYGETFRLLADE